MNQRIHKELKLFAKDRPEFVSGIHVHNTNMHHVHFLVHGPPGTPFENGEYVVSLILPKDYPMKPPRLQVKTPNGRFLINVDICASFTSYHPETWSPIHNFGTILRSFISFLTDTDNQPFHGRLDSTDEEKMKFAVDSKQFNLNNKYAGWFA